MPYATTDEMRSVLDLTDGSYEAMIDVWLHAASEAVDNFCNRDTDSFKALSSAVARVFPGRGVGYILIDECTEITQVAVKDSATATTYTAWTASDWLAFSGDPRHPEFNKLPYTGLMVAPSGSYGVFIDGSFNNSEGFMPHEDDKINEYIVPTVQVTARWGYADNVPPVIKQATITQAARWFNRGKSGWADTIASAQQGQLQYRSALDPDLKFMLQLGRYIRPMDV